MQWYVPAAVLPADLEATLNVIERFLETPIDLEGKKASMLLKKRRRRRVRESDDEDEDDEVRVKRREKKKREKEEYKSAQFIEDSDGEYGDMEAFLERERGLRERAEVAGAAAEAGQGVRPMGMRAHGRKIRKRREPTSQGVSSDGSDGGGQSGGPQRPAYPGP